MRSLCSSQLLRYPLLRKKDGIFCLFVPNMSLKCCIRLIDQILNKNNTVYALSGQGFTSSF